MWKFNEFFQAIYSEAKNIFCNRLISYEDIETFDDIISTNLRNILGLFDENVRSKFYLKFDFFLYSTFTHWCSSYIGTHIFLSFLPIWTRFHLVSIIEWYFIDSLFDFYFIFLFFFLKVKKMVIRFYFITFFQLFCQVEYFIPTRVKAMKMEFMTADDWKEIVHRNISICGKLIK